MKIPKNRTLAAIMVWWTFFLMITGIVLFLARPPINTIIRCIIIAAPAELVLTIALYYIIFFIWSNKYRHIEKLLEEYGPGQKCAGELFTLIIGEKNPAMKNRCIQMLASIYLEMGEAEKVIDTLLKMDKTTLYNDNSDPLRPYYEAEYQFLMMSAYDMLEDKDQIFKIYKNNLPLFKQVYTSKADQYKLKTIEVFVENCVNNYDKCLEILNSIDTTDNPRLEVAVLLNKADIYIKTGMLDEADEILNKIRYNIAGVANAKFYDKCCSRLSDARSAKEGTPKA